MMMADPLSSAERVARHRTKLRRAGLRPVQLWVPDTRSRELAEECQRQSQLIRERENTASQAEDEAWERASWEAFDDKPG
jgi:Protein  of unknown function (DUF3018)